MATLYAYSPNGTQATLSYSVIGFTQSLEQNGWCKLPNGLILQWGFADPGKNIEQWTSSVTYPLAITSVYSISAVIGYVPSYPIACTAITSIEASIFKFKCWGVNDASRHRGFRWMMTCK